MGDCHIFQDVHAQAVSHAAAALQSAVLDIGGEGSLRVLELGSGCGIVSIMLALQRPLWQIEAVEIQPELHALALKNALLCGVNPHFILGDLRTFQAAQAYDLVVSNPPWQKQGSGIPSKHQARNISRCELFCTMQDLLECLKRNLADAGEAVLLYPAQREHELRRQAEKSLLDIIHTLAVADLKEHNIYRIRHKGKTP